MYILRIFLFWIYGQIRQRCIGCVLIHRSKQCDLTDLTLVRFIFFKFTASLESDVFYGNGIAQEYLLANERRTLRIRQSLNCQTVALWTFLYYCQGITGCYINHHYFNQYSVVLVTVIRRNIPILELPVIGLCSEYLPTDLLRLIFRTESDTFNFLLRAIDWQIQNM